MGSPSMVLSIFLLGGRWWWFVLCLGAARIVMSERGDEGPIRPIHLREAHRRLRVANRIPSRTKAPLFS